MKKEILLFTLLSAGAWSALGQINQAGLPLSMLSSESSISNQYVSRIIYQAPDLQTVLKNDEKASFMDPKPARCGALIETDISFPQSGAIVTTSDGRRIWRAQFQITNAPALGLYYDQFHLPDGVRYYITNSNNKQVLGAYTVSNNSDDGLFATQMLQGNVANLELDIDKNVNLDDIKFHINKTAYMYRGIDYLNQYSEDGGVAAKPTLDPWIGSSAHCEINAICPQGSGFPDQRKATVRTIADLGGGYVGFCTATLINNTNQDCTPYMLTATHCESNNSKTNAAFSQWTFYFNFEAPICPGGGTVIDNNTMVGADFVARADFDSAAGHAIYGDFLLLKLRSKVPATYGSYLVGWNRDSVLSTTESFIGFHHPMGDIKKLAVGTGIIGTTTFRQNPVTAPNTHWQITFSTGGVEHGSSGSGLFDSNGRLVGDLTGGPDQQVCQGAGDTAMAQISQYSKFSRNWIYPEGNGVTNAQLKPWLDPGNTDAITTNTIPADAACSGGTGISQVNNALNNAISIYPNPVSTGIIRMKVNMAKQSDLNITFYDVTGARKAVYNLSKVSTGEFTFDISGFANGTYLMRINTDDATISKKVTLMH